MSQPYLVIVSYDIADPRRLSRVAKALEAVGTRVQKSIFECALTPSALHWLRLRLRRLIDPQADHILIIPICLHCRPRIRQQGKLSTVSATSYWMV